MPAPLLLRRFDAVKRADGTGRIPDMGAAHSGHEVSRAAIRVRKHLKCMRCPHPDTNIPIGAGNGGSPSAGGGMDQPVHATAKTDAAAEEDAATASNWGLCSV